MFTIKKATTNDIQLINEMAQIVFPATYREILSKEQLDYMMDWMYSPKNLRKQIGCGSTPHHGFQRSKATGIAVCRI